MNHRNIAERIAAAAAVYDPSLLARLQTPPAPEPPQRPGRPAETGGAALIAAAVALALLWANAGGYDAFWHTTVALGADLRTWIDEGLMTLFFLVVGLEAKPERDLGELREGRRLTVPVLAGLAGMVASAAVYLAVTAGQGTGAAGWGVAISTDTALALGALTIAAGVALWLALFESGIDPVVAR